MDLDVLLRSAQLASVREQSGQEFRAPVPIDGGSIIEHRTRMANERDPAKLSLEWLSSIPIHPDLETPQAFPLRCLNGGRILPAHRCHPCLVLARQRLEE